jgi:hypothetical protein
MIFAIKSCSLGPFQFQCHKIVRIGTSDLDHVAAPPGKISSELEGLQARENVMEKEAAQPGGVMTTDLEGFPHLMAGVAISFGFDNRRDHFLAYAWILSHFT